MDSPAAVARLFRRLFLRRPRGCRARDGPRPDGGRQLRPVATRASRDRGMKANESRWQQRTSILPDDRRHEFAEYPLMSARDLERRTERPRRVKMLLRDFIDGASPFPPP